MHAMEIPDKTEDKTPPDLPALMTEFAKWAVLETDAQTIGDAVAHAANFDGAQQAWRDLASATLRDAISDVEHPYDVIDRWREGLNERETRVFDDRISTLSAVSTLEEIGREFGISRQGVQDMERRLVKRLEDFARTQKGSTIRWRIETIRNRLGAAFPVPSASSKLIERVISPNYGSLLLKMAGPYEQQRDWFIHGPSLSSDPTNEILESADEFSCIDSAFARERLNEWGLPGEFHRDWLTRDKTIEYINGRYVRWNTGVGDKLAFALSDIGEPSSLDELIAHIDWQGARGTCQNAAGHDSRIVRISKSMFALRSWEHGEYSNIAASIRSVLEAASGPLHVSDLIHRLPNIKEGSIRSFCAAPMFVQEGGWVRLRSDQEPFRYDGTSIYQSKGVYYLGPGRATLLFEVDNDVLRGSGRPITNACGKILSLDVGDELDFRCADGTNVRVTFRGNSTMGPYMGSARKIVDKQAGKLGDWITIVFDRSEMTARIYSTDVSQFEPSWELVARLTGINPEHGSVELAMALGCDPDDVRPTLLHRNELVVANALP